MISDTFTNIHRYKSFHPDVFIGLEYLKTISPNIETGTYIVSDNVQVIVSEYPTLLENQQKYEAHRHVIDIQYPISGRERVQWAPLEGMSQCTEYDSTNDRTYYENPSHIAESIIGDGVFAIYFPEDAHNPQLAVNNKVEHIRKVTVKVSL